VPLFPLDAWQRVSRQDVPKSATLTRISSLSSRFCDLRSRWITPCACRYSMPREMSSASFRIVSGDSEYGSFLFRYMRSVPCDMYSVMMQYTGGFLLAAMNCASKRSVSVSLPLSYMCVHGIKIQGS
jgi:hypothetical protein